MVALYFGLFELKFKLILVIWLIGINISMQIEISWYL